MKYLANVCDGAQDRDGQGFSKPDSYNGKYLASKDYVNWTPEEEYVAASYAVKYMRQLKGIFQTAKELTEATEDILFSDIAEETARYQVTRERRKNYKAVSQAYLGGDTIHVVTPYNEGFLADGRKIASRRWNGAEKETTFHVSDVQAVLDLCDKYNIEVLFDPKSISYTPNPVKDEQKKAPHEKRISIEKGKILIKFPYDAELVSWIKSLNIATWDKENKCWKAEAVHAQKLINSGAKEKGFEIDKEIDSAALQSAANQENYSADDTEFRVIIPELRPEFKVLPHQWVTIEWALKNNHILNADSQGLGKTFASLSTLVIAKKQRTIVICPSSLVENWRKEAEMFFEEGTFKVYVAEGHKNVKIPEGYNLVIIGWPNITKWETDLMVWGADAIIVDEAHYGKSGKKSKRGEAFINLGKSLKNSMKIALTGTPILNRPLELLAILEFFGITKMFGGITKFKNRYCGPEAVETPYGTTFTYKGATHVDELHEILTQSGVYVRRTKKLLIKQGLLKNKYVNGVEFFSYEEKRKPTFISLNEEEKKAYQQVVEDFEKGLAQKQIELGKKMGLNPKHPIVVNALSSNKAGEALALLTEFRKRIGLLKVRAIKDHVSNLISKGERVVLFAHHREVVDAYAEEFGGIKIQGGMGAKKIEEAKAKFNTLPIEEAPVIVVSIEAGKTGHTLCLQNKNGVGKECRHAIFAEEPYVYGDAEQAEDRIYRIGQTRDVYIDNLMVEGTVDERIYNIREEKRKVFNAIIDGVVLEDEGEEEENVAKQILKGYL